MLVLQSAWHQRRRPRRGLVVPDGSNRAGTPWTLDFRSSHKNRSSERKPSRTRTFVDKMATGSTAPWYQRRRFIGALLVVSVVSQRKDQHLAGPATPQTGAERQTSASAITEQRFVVVTFMHNTQHSTAGPLYQPQRSI